MYRGEKRPVLESGVVRDSHESWLWRCIEYDSTETADQETLFEKKNLFPLEKQNFRVRHSENKPFASSSCARPPCGSAHHGRAVDGEGPNISFCFCSLLLWFPSLFGLLLECFPAFSAPLLNCFPRCSGLFLECFLLFLADFWSVLRLFCLLLGSSRGVLVASEEDRLPCESRRLIGLRENPWKECTTMLSRTKSLQGKVQMHASGGGC